VLKDGVPIIIQPIEHDESGATGIAVAMASFLAAMGMRGPCNFQCKLTENGPFFYEINPRFTGITAVRNSMDFCEVEACIRNFVLGESVEQVKATCLNTKFDLICSRYVTEYMVPTDDVEKIKESGKCAGSGWSVYL
jgi:carbamoylphosphate synthase large subunit